MAVTIDGTGVIGGVSDFSSSNISLTDPEITGGIYLGGTGSANYLEDYEEGEWTPTLPSGGTVSVVAGTKATYTKIGRQVTVMAYINVGSIPSNSSVFRIGGLPFTSATGAVSTFGAGSVSYSGAFNWSNVGGTLNELGSTNLYWHFIDAVNGGTTVRNSNVTSLDILIFSHTYFVA